MKRIALRSDPTDNVGVALVDLAAGTAVELDGLPAIELSDAVAQKHKFAIEPMPTGSLARMYGVTVGRTTADVSAGGALTTDNLEHVADGFGVTDKKVQPAWVRPDISGYAERTFDGYKRSNGTAGTANHWLIIPLVFCENRNLRVLESSLNRALGITEPLSRYDMFAAQLGAAFREGGADSAKEIGLGQNDSTSKSGRLLEHFDGVRSLVHTLGCGGDPRDSHTLCGLLAGYICHPNVAGATVLSLGCQHAQVQILQDEIARRDPNHDRPVLIYEQQQFGSENEMMERAIRESFLAITETVSEHRREPQTLDKLVIGVECGASDGFSGISANPAIGGVADRCVALGGSAILSEFPELCGVEQEFVNRCEEPAVAQKFVDLMRSYGAAAEASGSGFDMNPSPGNVQDGLITDAVKSAGAGKKGGTSPVTDVLDYPEQVRRPGLNLMCTPGNDVESTTAMAGAGANLMLFSTGLGTPTGNPISPVLKVSSNHATAERHSDMIDFDTGDIIDGSQSVDGSAQALLDLVIEVASGRTTTRADQLGQHDFQPWKRGVSL